MLRESVSNSETLFLFSDLQVGSTNHFLSDHSCSVKQVAIRKWILSRNEKPFLVQKILWDKMKVEQQAGLPTYEIIYEHFKKLGEENSVKARKLYAFLYTEKINKVKFWELISDLRVPIYP
ncbi:MAG: hypothetical protein ACXVCY_16660 [Pseudobdellovibrionaceae bacterium]